MPVPKKHHTCLPSVAGDGEALFPSTVRAFLLPPPIVWRQSSFPSVEKHISRRSAPSSLPSDDVTKILFPQMTGVAPPDPGIATRQARFSVRLHVVGSPFSVERPFPPGPRHCGQFSAPAMPAMTVTINGTTQVRLRRSNIGQLL